MKKLASVISTIALGTSFLACAGLGVAVANDAFGNKPLEVEAASSIPTSDGKLYVEKSYFTDWFNNCKVAVWFIGSTSKWSHFLTETYFVGSDEYYIVDIPSGTFTSCDVVRINPSYSEPNWDGKYNQTDDVVFSSSMNAIRITDWNNSHKKKNISLTYFSADAPYYLDTDATDWPSGSDMKAHFWNNPYDEVYLSLNQVLGFKNGDGTTNLKLFECIAPSGSQYLYLKFVRYQSGTSTIWNETATLVPNSNNVYKLDNSSDWNAGWWGWNYTATSRAQALGIYTYEQLGTNCGTNYSPTNTKSTFTTAWSNMKAQWTNMCNDAHTQFVAITANEKSANQYEVGAHYYDTCVQKYFSSDNFAGRGAKALTFTPAVFETEKKNYIEVFIACGAILILVGFSLAFLKVKRKEQ